MTSCSRRNRGSLGIVGCAGVVGVVGVGLDMDNNEDDLDRLMFVSEKVLLMDLDVEGVVGVGATLGKSLSVGDGSAKQKSSISSSCCFSSDIPFGSKSLLSSRKLMSF